jgi:hypothetical protein
MNYRRHYQAKANKATLKIYLPEIVEQLNNIGSGIDLTVYRDKPIEFATEILGVKHLTEEQKEILVSVRDRKTTNVQAAHSVGKSFSMALVVLWYVFAVGGQVFTTAPTLQQVKDILWKEIRQLYDKCQIELGGKRGELFVKKDESAKAVGYTAKHTDSNAFQGRHAVNLLLIQDEADGVSNTIDEAFESCLTGSLNRGVRIGNPLTTGSAFFKSCQLDKIKITVWQHPNVSWAYEEVLAENGKAIHRLKPAIAARILKPENDRQDDPVLPQEQWDEDLPRDVIPGAVSIAWIERIRVKYDEFSSYWESRIEANFPGDDTEGIIPLSWLKEARDRYDQDTEKWDQEARLDRWRIGVDVSDGGDRHAISVWRGRVLYSVRYIQPKNDREDTITLAKDYIVPLIKSLGGMYGCAVDNTGVGAGTLGWLRSQGHFAQGCKFGESPENKHEFVDRKTELYWWLRDGLRKGEIAIAPLGDVEEEVFEEIAAIRYNPDTDNKVKCEQKKETKKRLKRSPDGGDAVVIAGEIKPMALIQGNEKVAKKNENSEDRQLAQLLRNAQEWQDDISELEANKFLG